MDYGAVVSSEPQDVILSSEVQGVSLQLLGGFWADILPPWSLAGCRDCACQGNRNAFHRQTKHTTASSPFVGLSAGTSLHLL